MAIKLPARYTLVKALSGGGMSDTWLCKDGNLKRDIVIKSIKPGISPAKLVDELSALSSIRSRHVVQVLDVIYDASGDICGFVEEYIDGPPLTCPALPNRAAALRLLYPIACGIADIHEHGRLHRDIKPENMKFDLEGTLKVFDFGLAKIETNPGTAVLYYSPGFTAPEAFQKNAKGVHEYSRALDVFAFGATALWLLNQGKLPPEFSTLPPTIPKAGCDFSKLTPALPAPVSTMLNATLSAAPATRPTMVAVRDILGRHLLQNKHRMLLTYGSNDYVLDAANRDTTLTYPPVKISIHYDGLDFVVTEVAGNVRINNIAAAVGTLLKGASVIVLTAPGGGRVSITADVSHPEVMH